MAVTLWTIRQRRSSQERYLTTHSLNPERGPSEESLPLAAAAISGPVRFAIAALERVCGAAETRSVGLRVAMLALWPTAELCSASLLHASLLLDIVCCLSLQYLMFTSSIVPRISPVENAVRRNARTWP